ncbi:hypothetical protein NL478_27750, partial [Klebsiella pneumoniae]|nr:hypothetical protein [Klebsiella pneumoniae]
SKHALKVHKQLAFDNKYSTKGKIYIEESNVNVNCESIIMVRSPFSKLQDCIPAIPISRRKGIDDMINMNDEWKCMFGGPE